MDIKQRFFYAAGLCLLWKVTWHAVIIKWLLLNKSRCRREVIILTSVDRPERSETRNETKLLTARLSLWLAVIYWKSITFLTTCWSFEIFIFFSLHKVHKNIKCLNFSHFVLGGLLFYNQEPKCVCSFKKCSMRVVSMTISPE